MIVRRYLDPFTEINAIRRQLNDAFGDLTETATKATWSPAIRLVDRGDDLVLTVQLAGVHADDLDIQVTAEAISISGDRQAPEVPETAKLLYDDVRYGAFHRVVSLPDAVQNQNVQADFSNGVLTLTLPKVVEARNKVVKINLGQLNGETAQVEPAAPEATEA